MPVPKPGSDIEAEILQFYCESDPSTAFAAGFNEYGGRLFIPSSNNLDKFARKLEELRLKAENNSQLKALDSLGAIYALSEPQQIPDSILGAYFVYLIKEGIIPSHLRRLTKNAIKAMQTAIVEKSGIDWPVGLRLLTLIRCDGLHEIARTVRKETSDKQLRSGIDDLIELTKKYASLFRVKGFKNKGFDEVYKIIRKQGAELGREKVYAQSLRRLWDYPESPEEVEAKGLEYLNRELPRFKRLTTRLAKKYGVPARAEAVAEAMKKERSIVAKEVVPFLNGLRKYAVKVTNKNIVGVNPKYDAKVIETPLYLSGVVPSGAAYSFDVFTNNPKTLFMATTDPRRDPHSIPGELLNLLVHEEYGHCLHTSNSANAYALQTDGYRSPMVAAWCYVGGNFLSARTRVPKGH